MLSPKSVAGLTIYDSIICDHMIVSIVPTVRQHTHFMLYFADDSREIAESFIKKIEENSGIKFHQAMTALARQWVGPNEGPSDPVTVSVVVPTGKALTEPSAVGTKNETKKETYPLPATLEEANAIIDQFQRGAEGIRGDDTVSDTVSQHALLDETTLEDEKWEGTEEEERMAYVSELCYIHTKLMVVDDRTVIVRNRFRMHRNKFCMKLTLSQIGSANLNDRSQRVCTNNMIWIDHADIQL